MREVHSLRTNASLHAFTGNDAAHIADRMGRLLYTVAYAATAHGLNQTPEANILRGTANALSDIAASPAALETQRAAILAGLSAIDRLMPSLHEFSLAAGEPITKTAQVRMCGNSVCPPLARAIVAANYAEQHATQRRAA